jgi:hypothetical protein
MNRPFDRETENELLRCAEENPGRALVLHENGSATPAPAPHCYLIGDYEINGYHDSYFHVVYYDAQQDKIMDKEYGATAYGGSWNYRAEMVPGPMPEHIADRIRALRLAELLPASHEAERQRHEAPEPQQMPVGTLVRMLRDSRATCKTPYHAGETGTVLRHTWFGTFYRNGYNKRDRSNGRVTLRMADGRIVHAAMTAVRLASDPDMAAATARAEQAARFMRCPHAWWTTRNAKIAA